MKKLLAVLLALMLLAGLCACGAEQESAVEEKSEVVTETDNQLEEADDSDGVMEEIVDDSGSDSSAEDDEDESKLDEEAFEAAKECIGETIEVLYDTIGEPEEEPHYSSSCLQEDAQDGQHYYREKGFYVNTMKTAEEEIVRGVIAYD